MTVAHAADCAPIAPHQEQVSTEAARFSRLAFDARLERRLRRLADEPRLSVGPAAAGRFTKLGIDTAAGAVDLGFDLDEWPALGMAAALGDEATACAVATVLLSPRMDMLAAGAGLGQARVVALSGHAAPPAVAAAALISTPWGRVVVSAPQGGLCHRIDELLRKEPAGVMRRLAGLRVAGRIRVLTRTLPLARLAALVPGDTVLMGGDATPPRFKTLFGKGAMMQFDSEVRLDTGTVKAVSAPEWAIEPGGADDAGEAAVAELEVPVAFEIDTARVALRDLAAMQPGCVVELDQPVAAASVRLVCHGQTLGYGQLVAVGDRLGIRVIRMRAAP